jgi:hypothetical protein
MGQDGPIPRKYDMVLHLILLFEGLAKWVTCKLFGNAVSTTEISIKQNLRKIINTQKPHIKPHIGDFMVLKTYIKNLKMECLTV